MSRWSKCFFSLFFSKKDLHLNAVEIVLEKTNLEKNIGDVDKKIPDTSKVIETEDFNRLAKMNFNAKMVEALQILEIKIK